MKVSILDFVIISEYDVRIEKIISCGRINPISQFSGVNYSLKKVLYIYINITLKSTTLHHFTILHRFSGVSIFHFLSAM